MNLTATRLGLLVLLLMALLVTGIGTGSSFLGPDRVIAALWGTGERMDMVIVWTLRLPRVALAALAGAALALSGG
ncbi:iron chelate uptake ABC transporter family permease subunit, partial [Limimaricola soesokkakensis]|uniref:iron chelate uptake ABC transporter family permease subunit n=1 Tax=Limimaricola soesokkakensis TaxID=1343159 RepID=UPI003513DE35